MRARQAVAEPGRGDCPGTDACRRVCEGQRRQRVLLRRWPALPQALPRPEAGTAGPPPASLRRAAARIETENSRRDSMLRSLSLGHDRTPYVRARFSGAVDECRKRAGAASPPMVALLKMTPEPLIRDVSDTARWMAVYPRPRDRARRRGVPRSASRPRWPASAGERIAATLSFANENAWSFTARTYLFDRIVAKQVAQGCDLVLNLAAGLDTRPYRHGSLPASLRWVEVDLPEILDYKEQDPRRRDAGLRARARPPRPLERRRARAACSTGSAPAPRQILVLSEGLLLYLMRGEVGALCRRTWPAPPSGPALGCRHLLARACSRC